MFWSFSPQEMVEQVGIVVFIRAYIHLQQEYRFDDGIYFSLNIHSLLPSPPFLDIVLETEYSFIIHTILIAKCIHHRI